MAKSDAKIVNGRFIVEEMDAKIEGDDIFMHDSKKMLTGEEWVKINTDVEGELNLVMSKYQKM